MAVIFRDYLLVQQLNGLVQGLTMCSSLFLGMLRFSQSSFMCKNSAYKDSLSLRSFSDFISHLANFRLNPSRTKHHTLKTKLPREASHLTQAANMTSPGPAPLEPPQPFPEFHPKLHKLPTNSVTLTYLQDKKRSGSSGAFPWDNARRIQMGSIHSPKKKITILWLCHTADDNGDPADVNRRNQTEDICRAEADNLKLNYVVIRNGLHNTRNHTVDGRPVKYWDHTTKRWQTIQKKADYHFTVWMGKPKEELLLHSHIYVDWDGYSVGNISKMKNPEVQRQHVVPGEKPVAEEWWCLTTDEPELKEEVCEV